jgi:Domain of unknown function (DUF4760)
LEAAELELYLGFFETGLILLGLLIAAYQVHQAAKAVNQGADHHREANAWNRKIAAQDALDKIGSSPVLSKIQQRFKYIDQLRRIPISEIDVACAEDPELKVELFELLNAYEKLARGVNMEIYDNDVIRIGRRGAITKALYSFSEMIEHRRISYGAPSAWKELELLVEQWEASQPTWLSLEHRS